jgi:hypothetical protein
MSDTPIQDALARLEESGDGLDVTVTKPSNGPTAVTATATKRLGKGWTASGAVRWAKDQWAALGSLTWRSKE